MPRRMLSAFTLALLLGAAPALAQNYYDNNRDNTTVEDSAANVARLNARIAALEEQIRGLNGRIEEAGHANVRLTDRLDRLQRDIDLRFQQLPASGAPAAMAPPVAPPPPIPESAPAAGQVPPVAAPPPPIPASTPAAPPPAAQAAPLGQTPATPPLTQSAASGNAQDDYNYAFKLLNQSRYDEAATAFDQFIKAYPKNALVGNAYYWLGETHYARGDYGKAADQFRQGFETAPKGAKAADNLLKLSMSLSGSGNSKDACTILAQMQKRYPNASGTVKQKAAAEHTRLGCQ